MFTAAELEYMREVQEEHMMDICVFQTHTFTADAYNQQVESWVDGESDIVCGLEMRPGSERRNQDMTVLTYDATLRVPIDTVIDVKERVKIKKRHGETLATPLVYDIVGTEQRGASGIRFLLRRIEL